MSLPKTNWQGAPKLVSLRRIKYLGAWCVAEGRLRNMLNWWAPIVTVGVGNPVLLLLSVGLGVGMLVDTNQGANAIDGVGYLTFLAPALLSAAAIQAWMDETSFPTLEGFIWNKNFFSINSTALDASDIVNGVMLAAFARTVLTVIIFEAVLLAFGALAWGSVLPVALTAILVGASFGSAMLAGASVMESDDGFFELVSRFIVAPLMLFSGTYYPLESLPIYLQPIGWISPMWHATNLGRFASYGREIEPWLLTIHFSYLVILLIFGLWFARRQFERRLGS